jgi:predicted aspartyl protease
VFHYNSEIDPPLPTVRITITNPHNQKSKSVNAIIDTGADVSCVPRKVADKLGLNYTIGEFELQDFEGQLHPAELVSVQISFTSTSSTHRHETRTKAVRVDSDEAIVGRDILNCYKLVLNAPFQRWGFDCSCIEGGSDWSQSQIQS